MDKQKQFPKEFMQFLIDDNRTNHMEAKQDKNVKKTSRGNMPRFAKNDSNGN